MSLFLAAVTSVADPFSTFPAVVGEELSAAPLRGFLTVLSLLTKPSSLGLEIFIGFTASTGFLTASANFLLASEGFLTSFTFGFSIARVAVGKAGAGAIFTSLAGGGVDLASLDFGRGLLPLFSSWLTSSTASFLVTSSCFLGRPRDLVGVELADDEALEGAGEDVVDDEAFSGIAVATDFDFTAGTGDEAKVVFKSCLRGGRPRVFLDSDPAVDPCSKKINVSY